MIDLAQAIKSRLEARAPHGIPTGEDLNALNAVAHRKFSAEEVFVYPEVMANTNMTAYAVRIGEVSLRQFAMDAQRGVPVHIQHERPNRAIGITFAGYYDEEAKEARAAVLIPKNRVIDGYNSNDEIEDIRNGLRRYVSVGPGGAFVSATCDLCGKDVFDWSGDGCMHIPGMKYGDKWASATLEGLNLIEVSNVDRGALPGAEIGAPAQGNGAPLITGFASLPGGSEEMGVIPPFLASSLSQKATMAFRASKVTAADYRTFMDQRGFRDDTKTFSTPPASSGKEVRKPMRDRLVAALTAAGLTAIATFMANVEDDPEKLAAALAAQFSASVNEALTNHPVLAACSQAGIRDVPDFENFRRNAELGVEFESQIRGDAEKHAIAAFGQDASKPHIETCKSAPLSTVRTLSATFQAIADREVGRPPNGPNGEERDVERQTAPRNTGTFSVDVEDAQQSETQLRLAEKARQRRKGTPQEVK